MPPSSHPFGGIVSPFGQRRAGGGAAAFDPASLFANGEAGAWFEPSPTTTFADTAGTTAAAVGDAVARMNDLSGNGNHATQSDVNSQPILARVPKGGRRNKLSISENLEESTTPSPDSTVSGNTLIAKTQSGAQSPKARANLTLPSATSFMLSVDLVDFTGKATHGVLKLQSFTESIFVTLRLSDGAITFDDTGTAVAVAIPGGYRVSFIIDATGWTDLAGILDYGISERDDFVVRITDPTTADSGKFTRVQLEEGSTATDYQKVTSEHDVTEEGKADTWHFFDDGVDDAMPATLPDLGTDAAVAYASDQGVTILTGQTIGAGDFDILRDKQLFAMVILDRAMTASETDGLTAYLEGVSP